LVVIGIKKDKSRVIKIMVSQLKIEVGISFG